MKTYYQFSLDNWANDPTFVQRLIDRLCRTELQLHEATERAEAAESLIKSIQGVLGTAEEGADLVEVALNACRAEQELANKYEEIEQLRCSLDLLNDECLRAEQRAEAAEDKITSFCTEIERLKKHSETAKVLLREWLDTELDSMDEDFEPWLESFAQRCEAVLREDKPREDSK